MGFYARGQDVLEQSVILRQWCGDKALRHLARAPKARADPLVCRLADPGFVNRFGQAKCSICHPFASSASRTLIATRDAFAAKQRKRVGRDIAT